MKASHIIGSCCIMLTVVFTVYIAYVMLRRAKAVVLKGSCISVFRHELIVCGCFLLFALDLRFGVFTATRLKALRSAGWILRVIVILADAVFLFFIGKITLGGFIRTDTSAQTALVLGMALENGKPVNDLILRLDTAEQYLRENPGATLVLTGGNPDASGRTEAAVMRDILLARGVDESRLRLEDRAETTRQNFRNTALLIDPGEPTVIITSNYHMDRAVQTAKNAGFVNILRMPAPSSVFSFAANVMWELVTELHELTLDAKTPWSNK